jgi:hypothetical protein
MQAWRGMAVMGLLAGLAGWLTGCEGTTTGKEIASVELQPGAERGTYAPVKFTLTPEMNPVAVNFRADFMQDPAEFGKWNTYRAVLTQGGATVAMRNFNVNHPQNNPQGDAPPPSGTVHTLFVTDVPGSGECELIIKPLQAVAITLKNARVDVRSNVARPPQ